MYTECVFLLWVNIYISGMKLLSKIRDGILFPWEEYYIILSNYSYKCY